MPDPDALPPPDLSARRRGGLSAAWLAPLLALAVAGAAAWRHYAAQGPEIEIVLAEAAGVEAGRTAIRYRDVEIGRVQTLRFEDDLSRVVAVARMEAGVAEALTRSARFWVVRPTVSAAGVSGLETLLSGVHIGVDWGDRAAAPARRFEALPAPPPTPAGTPGRRLVLRAASGGAALPGTPVLFRGVQVGAVETRGISADGAATLYEVFVNAPHDQRIGPTTRFWDVSGFSVDLGPGGVSLGVASLATLLRGGVAFDAIDGAAPVAEEGTRTLYPSRAAAEDSVFEAAPGEALRFSALFEQSVRGLEIGAPVEYRGVRVGEVEALDISPGETLDATRIRATLRLQPRRLGLQAGASEDNVGFFARSVERGLKVRLATGSLVTGALYVELVDGPRAEAGALDMASAPHPLLPTAPTALDALRAQAESVLARLAALPVEELLASAIAALDNAAALAADPDLRRAPAALAETLTAVSGLFGELRDQDAAGSLASALSAADGAARALAEAAGTLPELSRRLNGLVARLEAALEGYGPGSPVNSEALAALREARAAARSVASLAQSLERRPNSLILGR